MNMPLATEPNDQDGDLVALTADIVSVYVSHNSLSSSDLPQLIGDTYGALRGIQQGTVEEVAPVLTPAVSVRNSVTPDYIICLDDGKRFKSMRRHIANLGMTPEQYREKWNLPSDYPMVAANYSVTRAALARKIGLGKKRAVEVKPTFVAKRKSK